ncbi:MAG: T9SS type A sorting domain-containing protein [Crocinitomicaceae bacterium]
MTKTILLLTMLVSTSCALAWNTPAVTGPANGANTWTGIELDWNAVSGSQFYQLQVDTSNNFNTPLLLTVNEAYINSSSVNNDTDEFVTDLLFGETYYWRVRAGITNDTSSWTTVRSFTTNDFVTLSSPANGADVWTGTEFDWLSHHGIDFYEIQVDTSANFNSPVFQSDLEAYINSVNSNNDSEEFITDMLFGETYYWRVRAINAADTSAWTTRMVQTRDFVTLDGPSSGASVWTGTEFDWLSHHGVDFYEIQVDTTTNFNSPAFQNDVEAYINSVNSNNDSEEFITDMLFGETYFWCVRAINAADTSAWTMDVVTTRDFVTLNGPASGASVWTGNEFDWLSHDGVDFYEIQVDTSANFNSPAFQNDVEAYINTVNTNNDTEEFVTDMLFGEMYYWRVRSINAADTSAWSTDFVNTRDFVTLDGPTSGASVWTGNEFDWLSHDGVDFYEIQVDTSANFNSPAFQNDVEAYINTVNSIIDRDGVITDMLFGEMYCWRVRAINTADTSAWSTDFVNTRDFVTLNGPASGASVWTGTEFDWLSHDGVDFYEIQVDTSVNFNSPVFQNDLEAYINTVNSNNDTEEFINDMLFGEMYYWRVRAINAADTSAWTTDFVNTRDFVTLTSPSDFALNQSTTSVNLNWNSHHGVDFYELQWDTTNTFSSTQLQSILETYITTSNSFNDTQHPTGSLLANTVYSWRVRAINAVDTSAWSSRVFSTGSTPIQVPQVPTLITPTDIATQVSNPVNFDWSNTANTSYYEHQYSLDPSFAVNTSNLTSTSDYTATGLQVDTIYYWRVRSGSNGFLSDWSQTWQFDTDACAPTSSTLDVNSCANYVWNGTTYSNSGSYTETFTNSAGCDSIATLNLIILTPTSSTDAQMACQSYTWIDGNTYTSSNNTATYTLSNSAGCDSIITLDLTIFNVTPSTDTQVACDSYTWIDGNTYTSSNNTATYTLPSSSGCDSVITLDLTINTVGVSVTQNGDFLSADETGATYQWIDCQTMAPISGATNQFYTATANGDYAVIVTKNGCSDTSACFTVSGLGIVDNDFGIALRAYPNPTKGQFSVDLGENYQDVTLQLLDLTGKVVQSNSYLEGQNLDLTIDESAGVYLLKIDAEGKNAVIRLVKE